MDSIPAPMPSFHRERFNRIVSYYLDCLEAVGGYEVSDPLFKENRTFLELPLDTEWGISESPDIAIDLQGPCAEFAYELRRRGGSAVLYYGYPLFVRWIEKSARGWTGGIAIPVFLQPIEHTLQGNNLVVRLVPELPRLNPEFVSTAGLRPEEKRHVLQTLGLFDAEELPEDGLAGIVRRMPEVCGPWGEMVEPLDPEAIQRDPPLAALNSTGFYNRSLLFIGERSPYTKGLERELPRLRDNAADEELSRSGLRLFFRVTSEGATRDVRGLAENTLAEVVPLNDEQRRAMRSAFANDLTVVTGPPGTGKSQVVLSVLANAYLRGERVLFASYNNKAVDVVETRLNELADNRILLRTGRRADIKEALLAFLTHVLSVAPTEDDRSAESEAEQMVRSTQQARDGLWFELEQVKDTRNSVDRLDRRVSALEKCMSPELVKAFRELSGVPPGCDPAQPLGLLAEQMDHKGGLFHRLRLFFRRSMDIAVTEYVAEQLARYPSLFGKPPGLPLSFKLIRPWHEFLDEANRRLDYLRVLLEYREALAGLLAEPTTPELAEKLSAIEDELWEWGSRYITAKGKTVPDRLDVATRKALGAYAATIKKLAGGEVGSKVYAGLMRQQKRLFHEVSSVIPAWCVTSLSASGSIPCESGIFDLVVIDEASQCDIPSALPLLFRARRAMVIGDPNQLRHVSGISEHDDQQLLGKHSLVNPEDMPYSYGTQSLYDLAKDFVKKGEIIDLREHFRSHADIVSFSNRQWYGGRLEVCTDYRRLATVEGWEPGVRWTDIAGSVKKQGGRSAVNQEEALAVAREVKSLLVDRRFQGSVGVVSPFRAQRNRIFDLVNDSVDPGTLERAGFLVDTAHGFQGDERDVMIFSPCISRDMPSTAAGFLSSTGNLFNVAITRARTLLHVIGDKAACLASEIPHARTFAKYVDSLQSRPEPTYTWDTNGRDPRVGHWERPLYEALVAAGLRPMAQYPVNQYKLDLAIKDGNFWLDIEVDGELYHKEWDGTRCRRDLIRDLRLTALNWHVKRFWVYRIRDDMPSCVREVLDILNKGKGA